MHIRKISISQMDNTMHTRALKYNKSVGLNDRLVHSHCEEETGCPTVGPFTSPQIINVDERDRITETSLNLDFLPTVCFLRA